MNPLYRTQNCIKTKIVAKPKCNKNLLGNSPDVLEWNLSTLETNSVAVVDMVSAVFILEEGVVREELENLLYSKQYPRVISKLVFTVAT